jgi:hypothetical protein
MVVVASFLAVLALWLLYSSVGALLVVTAGPITTILALPPLSSLLDLQFVLASLRLFDPWTTVLLIAVLVLLRAWLSAVLIGLLLDEERRDPAAPSQGWRSRLRTAARVRPQTVLTMAGLLIFLAAAGSFVSTFSQILGPIGGVAAITLEMFFLGFTPVVAMAEGQGIVPTLRLGVRAGRLQGSQLIVFLLPYVFVSVLLEAPGLRFTDVTLSMPEWVFALVATVFHVFVLASLTHRWLAIREQTIAVEVEAAEARISRRRGSASVIRRRGSRTARRSSSGSGPSGDGDGSSSEG